MSTDTATIAWQRDAQAFVDHRYSRRHSWRFDGGAVVPASASPHIVPLPMSDAAGVDPEEAFCRFAVELPYAVVPGYRRPRWLGGGPLPG